MFPEEDVKLKEDIWAYTWKARESSCEVTSLDPSPLSKNHSSFLESAFCTLLQTHFVNSPFDELKISADDIVTSEGKVQIRTGLEEGLGLFLDPKSFTIETKTKNRGVLRAVYVERDHHWLPVRLEERHANTQFVIDQIEYDDVPVGGRLVPKSFWISVGEQQAFPHTQISLSNCRNF
jgi:hypothetical protein